MSNKRKYLDSNGERLLDSDLENDDNDEEEEIDSDLLEITSSVGEIALIKDEKKQKVDKSVSKKKPKEVDKKLDLKKSTPEFVHVSVDGSILKMKYSDLDHNAKRRYRRHLDHWKKSSRKHTESNFIFILSNNIPEEKITDDDSSSDFESKLNRQSKKRNEEAEMISTVKELYAIILKSKDELIKSKDELIKSKDEQMAEYKLHFDKFENFCNSLRQTIVTSIHMAGARQISEDAKIVPINTLLNV